MKTLLAVALLLTVCTFVYAQAPGTLKVPAGPCGDDADIAPFSKAGAGDGRFPGDPIAGSGLSLVSEAKAEFAARSFTFEAWIRWPEEAANKYQPEIIAEAKGDRWNWVLGFNDVGCPYLSWGAGRPSSQFEGQMSYDIIRPGRWHHLAVVFDASAAGDQPRVMIFLTEEGLKKPFLLSMGGQGGVPTAEAEEKVTLAIGRGIAGPAAGSQVRVGSAAFYERALAIPSLESYKAPTEVPADIVGKLPEGVRLDADFEMGSLGQYGQMADGTILYACPPLTGNRNYWYAFRVRGAKGKTLTFQNTDPEAMGISPWVNEDGLAAIAGPYGTKNWVKPSQYVHRGPRNAQEKPLWFSFSHTFGSDDALVAGCPMITAPMADAWLDEVAAKQLGAKIITIGKSPKGHPLRVAEVGNHDAPLVWWQCGQHSAVERFGYHMAITAYELAAKDPELMKKTRWLILPVVNVDSYMVSAVPGEPNYNRVWQASATHPTVSAIRKFLEAETARTGTLAAFDCHAGTVQRGNTLAMGGSVQGLFEKYTREAGVTFRRNRATDWTAQPPAAPADLTNWHPGADSGTFNGFGSALPLVRAAYTLELSTMAHRMPQGIGPMSVQAMSNDGVGVYKALKQIINAPMPPPSTQPAGGGRGGPAAGRGTRGRGAAPTTQPAED